MPSRSGTHPLLVVHMLTRAVNRCYCTSQMGAMAALRALRLKEIQEAEAAKHPAKTLITTVDFGDLKKHLEEKGEGKAVICTF